MKHFNISEGSFAETGKQIISKVTLLLMIANGGIAVFKISRKMLLVLVVLVLVACGKENKGSENKESLISDSLKITPKEDSTSVKSDDSESIITPTAAINRSEEEPDTFDVNVGNFSYRISSSGGIYEEGAIAGTTNSFTIKIPRGLIIEKFYLAHYNKDLIIFYTATDLEGATSFIARLDRSNNILKWTGNIPAFNMGPPIIKGGNAYVTAIGFVGKINLESGQYVWKHGDLYTDEHKAYNSFEIPEFFEDKVHFFSMLDSKKKDSIIVRDDTGEIINKQ